MGEHKFQLFLGFFEFVNFVNPLEMLVPTTLVITC